MATAISKDVIKTLGGTLKEDEWWGANGVLDSSTADSIVYNGKTHAFSQSDFYTDEALETKLESIFGGDIDIVADAGWNSSAFKYLVQKKTDSWWGTTVRLIGADGKEITTGSATAPKPNTPAPKPQTPPTNPDDNY